MLTWLIRIKILYKSRHAFLPLWAVSRAQGLGMRLASDYDPCVGHCTGDNMATEQSMLIPCLGISVRPSVLRSLLRNVVQTMGYRSPTEEQEKVVTSFVCGQDVFVSLPTGSDKSLCYTCLSRLFNELRGAHGCEHHSIAVVVSPLSSVMQDQVHCFGLLEPVVHVLFQHRWIKYNGKGLKAAFVGKDQNDDKIKGVQNGEYELVYISPQSMLRVLKYREMFRSTSYQNHAHAQSVFS